jgi:hypothetical protein
VSCICGQAGVDGHLGVCGGLRLGQASGRILDVGASMETGWSLRAATWTRRLVRRGRRSPEPLLPQVTARLKDDEQSPCWRLVAAGGHQKGWEAEGLLLLLPLAGLRTAGEPRRLPTT